MGTQTMVSVRQRTNVRRTTGASPKLDSKAEAITELMLEVAKCFFRIRAIGQKTGLITSWGGGAFGFMRSLALLGSLTVPQIAQMRPTSRQRMQRLADELAAEGLVEFIDNPKHRRSKLVRLTPEGDARYRELNAEFLVIASTVGVSLAEADIRKTIEIVRHLSDDVGAVAKGRPSSPALLPPQTRTARESGCDTGGGVKGLNVSAVASCTPDALKVTPIKQGSHRQ